jgi:hypothetical protein
MIYECKLAPDWDKEVDKHGGIYVEWKYGRSIAYPIQPYGMFSVPSSDIIRQEGVNVSVYVTFIENKNRLHYLGFRIYKEKEDVTEQYGHRQVWYSPDWIIIQEKKDDGSSMFSISYRPGKFFLKIEIDNSGSTTKFEIEDSNNKTNILSASNKLTLKRAANPTNSTVELSSSGVKVDGQYVLLDSYYQQMHTLMNNLISALVSHAGVISSIDSAFSANMTAVQTFFTTNFPNPQASPDQYYSKK